jgi:hypothetical protein
MAPFDEWDATLGDESADMSHCHAEMSGDFLDRH